MASRLVRSICYFMLVGAAAAAVEYELQWFVPPSADYYVNWTSNKTFEVGDSVKFNWTGTRNVADVSKSEYENCTKTNSVIASPVKITFESGGNRYFICTVDSHCDRGQKLDVTIKNRGNSENNTGSAAFVTVGSFSAVLPISLIYFLNHYYV